jgi:hypothetical protein
VVGKFKKPRSCKNTMHLLVTSDSQGNVQITEELSKDSFFKHFVSSQGKLQKHGLVGDSKTYTLVG